MEKLGLLFFTHTNAPRLLSCSFLIVFAARRLFLAFSVVMHLWLATGFHAATFLHLLCPVRLKTRF